MQRIAETIKSVPIPAIGPDWHRRILLGCWSARYMPYRIQYLSRYPVTLICVDLTYARQFFQVPGISFNVNQKILMGPLGRGFLEDVQAARRQVLLWTVNEPTFMRWGIRHQVDGIITDDPALYKQIREEWEKEHREGSPASQDPASDQLSFPQRFQILLTTFFVVVFGWYLRRKYHLTVERIHFEERKLE